MRNVVSVSNFNVLAGVCAAVMAMMAATPVTAAPTPAAVEFDASALVDIGAADDTAAGAIKAFVSSELGGWVVLGLGAGVIVILSRRRRRESTD